MFFAFVVKLVDTLSSGGSALGCGGSTPPERTKPFRVFVIRSGRDA